MMTPSRTFEFRTAIATILVTGLFGCTAGCGEKQDDRVAVSGTVTYDGQPVQDGQIVFEPQNQGRMGVGAIVDGHYSIAPTNGPTTGTYIVRITGNRPTGEKAEPNAFDAPGASMEIYEQYIPGKYNAGSELVTDIDGNTNIKRDFELVSN